MNNATQVYEQLVHHQLEGVMVHSQLANLFDFLGLRGYKREQEYHYLSETLCLRTTYRYCINHHNKLITHGTVNPPRIIPDSWKNYSRFDVDKNSRRQAISEAFDKWKQWEADTKKFYSDLFSECATNKWIADANRINELIKDVDDELKYLERQIIELKACDYDILFILSKQDNLHEHYKEKTKDIGFDIC